jgi:hypothetical protein
MISSYVLRIQMVFQYLVRSLDCDNGHRPHLPPTASAAYDACRTFERISVGVENYTALLSL